MAVATSVTPHAMRMKTTPVIIILMASMLEVVLSTTALEPPVVQPFLISKKLRLGNRLNLYCAVVQGDLPLKFQWYHNGKELQSTTTEDSNDSTLKINSIKASDLGNYTCLVSNAAGSDSYTAKLEVEAPPIWQNEPQDTSGVLDSSVAMHCSTIGHPKPTVSWMKEQDGTGNNFVPVLSDSRRNILDNGTLVVSRVSNEDAGYYKCVSQNGIPPELSKIIKLVVKVPPRLVESFRVENVRRGEAAILKCQAIGDQPVSITWKKGNKVLALNESERLEIIQKETPTGAMSELVIRQSERQDGGIFVCVAKNAVGEEEGKLELVIAEPPSAPLSVGVSEVSSRSVRLSWRPAVAPSDEPLVGYLVRYWKTAGGAKKLKDIKVVQQESSVLLKDLSPGTSYTAQVLAQNAVGFSEPSKAAGFRTHEEAPSTGPTDIRVEAIGRHEISVCWKTPPADHWNGILKGYYVGHRPFGSSAPFSFKTVQFAEYQSDEGVLVQGLEKDTKYSIIVKAFNSAGAGPPSHEIMVKTPAGDTPAAPVLTIPEISISEVKMTWFPLNQNIQPIIQYLLQYRREGSAWSSLHIPAGREYLLLNHLDQGKHYDFKMAAYNKFGIGNFSTPIGITTDSGFTIGDIGPKEFVPMYAQPQLVIPVAASFVVIVTAIVVAWVCYKKHLIIQQQQAAENPVIPPDQMYPYNRNSLTQSDGYCDISRIPLYLQQNGVIQASSGSLERRRNHQEETYDTPWDTSGQHDDRNMSGNYTRLKNGPHVNAAARR